ncbi:hypothetical protein AMC82_CH01185 [Rhizobium phaseoli]|nr:hypothetical protein AMC82_CH01185 [Rhizobium phaseoli]
MKVGCRGAVGGYKVHWELIEDLKSVGVLRALHAGFGYLPRKGGCSNRACVDRNCIVWIKMDGVAHREAFKTSDFL